MKNNKITEQVETKPIIKKVFKGVVVSDKMDKTLVVAVETVKINSKYHRRYVSTSRYKVHDPENRFKEGDKVSLVECRPLSKEKRWRVIYQ